MKNLQLCDLNRFHLPKGYDEINNLVYVHGIVFFVEHCKLYFCPGNATAAQPLCEDKVCITELVHIPSLEQVWFGTGSEYIFISTRTFETKSVETPSRFLSAAWSPNNEYIAVCEIDGKIRCYRNCFTDPVVNVNFEDESNEPLPKDVTNVSISWRDDSQDFCVCYLDNAHKLRVYNISGQIVIKTLSVPNMIPCVTWRRGMIICARKDDDGKFFLNIYERNGLFHAIFELDPQVIDILKIKWNEISDALAVHILTENGTFVNLYTQVNFKYQLKQQIVSTPENPIRVFAFLHCTEYMVNLLVANSKRVIIHKLISVIQTGILPDGSGFHADVDGRQLTLHRIDGDALAGDGGGADETIQVIETAVPINSVAFHYAFKKLIVVDAYSNIFLYTYIQNQLRRMGVKLSTDTPGGFITATFYNLCFVSDDKVLAVYLNNIDTHDLYELSLFNFTMMPTKLDEHIIYLTYVPEYDQLLKLNGNKILFLNDYQHLSVLSSELHKINYAIIDGEFYLITLDVTEQLRVNNNVLCKNASSFMLHEGYLYLTAFSNKLYCVRLNSNNMRLLCNYSITTLQSNIFARDCEDGSLILAGVPNHKHVVLFHTRGNTESILCRNVAIDQIEAFIDGRRWKEAFEFIRVERLDLNLIVDINPKEFVEHTGDFVDAIECQNMLHLFLLSLADDNVLESTYRDVNFPNIVVINDKRKVISKRILDHIRGDMVKYCKVAILCAKAIGGIPACMEVLHHIFTTYERVDDVLTNGLNCLSLYYPPAEIRRSCLIKLDVEFVKFIFDKLNVDPKEHQKLFEKVRRHESNVHRQFYIIHDYIENYKDALQYLVTGCMYQRVLESTYDDAEDIEEMIAYANGHRIFPTLYKCCVKHRFFNRKIVTIYTDKLRYLGRQEEAALIFRANSMWEEALEIFIGIRMWRDALLVLDHLSIDKQDYINSLAKSLKMSGNHRDAAHLYDEYLRDPELAISSYIACKLFKEAVHCASKYDRDDITENTIRCEYLNYYNTLIDKIEEIFKTYKEYLNRLQELRSGVVTAGGAADEASQDCAESVAGSLRSASTSRTRSSSSSRTRKDEKKKQDLRKGGTYESIALMRALHNLVSEAYGLCPDVRTFCDLLIACESDGFFKGKVLQDALSNLISTITRQITTIWPPNLNSVNVPVTTELTNLRKNLDQLEMKYRYPPEPVMVNWKLSILDELVDPANQEDTVA